MIRDIALIIGITLMYATPLIYTALGGVISEVSGVVNIGLEGMMTIGAFTGAAVGVMTGNPWLAFLAAGLAGGLFGLIHAIASISFNANQVISGAAINFLAPGLALFISKRIFNGASHTPPIDLNNKMPQLFSNVFPSGGVLELIFKRYATEYLAFFLVFVIWYLLTKTQLGLRIRAVGEHPRAADTLGINVYKVRYFSVILSGILAGLGGASMSLAIVSNFRQTLVSGQGFIALAAMIFGKWKPVGAMWACLLFGLSTGIRLYLGGSSVGIQVSDNLLSMIPYVITLIVLMGFVGKASAPAANGEIYEKGER